MNFDPHKKFVHVVDVRPDGFVQFEFAVGEPELFVEMILPVDAFEELCSVNEVALLDEAVDLEAGTEDWNWRLRDATRQRFK
jgi:phenol hydroxylase P0 protein